MDPPHDPSEKDRRIVAESEPIAEVGGRMAQSARADEGTIATESEPMISWSIDCDTSRAS